MLSSPFSSHRSAIAATKSGRFCSNPHRQPSAPSPQTVPCPHHSHNHHRKHLFSASFNPSITTSKQSQFQPNLPSFQYQPSPHSKPCFLCLNLHHKLNPHQAHCKLQKERPRAKKRRMMQRERKERIREKKRENSPATMKPRHYSLPSNQPKTAVRLTDGAAVFFTVAHHRRREAPPPQIAPPLSCTNVVVRRRRHPSTLTPLPSSVAPQAGVFLSLAETEKKIEKEGEER